MTGVWQITKFEKYMDTDLDEIYIIEKRLTQKAANGVRNALHRQDIDQMKTQLFCLHSNYIRSQLWVTARFLPS